MTKNKHSRVAKLEAQISVGKWRQVIPMCCFYDSEDKKCDCYPHYTQEPFVVMGGLKEFYEMVEKPCPPMPKDAITEKQFKELGLKL